MNPEVEKRNEEDQLQLEWRRAKVLELSSKGYIQREIADILKLAQATISRDLKYLRQQSKEKIRHYIDEQIPNEYEKCMVGVNTILKESWIMSKQADTIRDKTTALHLAKECYAMKMDLLTNAGVVDDAIRFINEHKDKIEKKDDIQRSKEENREQREEQERIF